MHGIKNKETLGSLYLTQLITGKGWGDMRLVCFSLFAFASAFPMGSPWGRNELENYEVQLVEYGGFPQQRQSLCQTSPFLRQIRLPSAIQFFLPLETLIAERRRCLSIPIVRTHIVKVCPPEEFLPRGENSGKSLEEIIKQDGAEAETERLRDNANIEVNGGEVDSKLFVKKGRSDESKESKLGGESSGNKISRVSEEIEENESTERPPTDKNFDDEYPNIASNLV